MSLRPDREGTTTRVVLTLQRCSTGEYDLDIVAQKAFLHDRFADAGWETPRVLDGMASTEDFYFDALRQVRMERWSKGRVVLLGDAAWCVTPLGGAGATLAIVGAYVLAGELARGASHVDAFAAYERVRRRSVEHVQGTSKFGARIAQPHSRLGILAQRAALGIAARPAVQKLVKPLIAKAPNEIEVPDYGDLSGQS